MPVITLISIVYCSPLNKSFFFFIITQVVKYTSTAHCSSTPQNRMSNKCIYFTENGNKEYSDSVFKTIMKVTDLGLMLLRLAIFFFFSFLLLQKNTWPLNITLAQSFNLQDIDNTLHKSQSRHTHQLKLNLAPWTSTKEMRSLNATFWSKKALDDCVVLCISHWVNKKTFKCVTNNRLNALNDVSFWLSITIPNVWNISNDTDYIIYVKCQQHSPKTQDFVHIRFFCDVMFYSTSDWTCTGSNICCYKYVP